MKSIAKSLLFYCIICGVICIVLLSVGLFLEPVTRSKTKETQNIIKQVYRFIDYTAIAMGFSCADDFVSTCSTTNSPADLLGTILARAVDLGDINPPAFLHNEQIWDPWGKPMNVAWRSDIIQNAQKLSWSPMELVIWSSGRNGRNEFGNGDDIIMPFDAEMQLNTTKYHHMKPLKSPTGGAGSTLRTTNGDHYETNDP